ncbi:hypothetical protein [Tuberibacillus sp. Marseille-P3662]|uniref:hypothetical protein n=1 Tax=Tuberibacillus sp. Marseille-P3662 TaxID=1965358 RepID=UPI000A1C9D75|nr:hypothetical protein [Tuberibacillus sp. Marseille-P3662]
MLSHLIGKYPPYLILICTVLSFVVPYTIYKINHYLHQLGDPPWKIAEKEDEQKNEKNQVKQSKDNTS